MLIRRALTNPTPHCRTKEVYVKTFNGRPTVGPPSRGGTSFSSPANDLATSPSSRLTLIISTRQSTLNALVAERSYKP